MGDVVLPGFVDLVFHGPRARLAELVDEILELPLWVEPLREAADIHGGRVLEIGPAHGCDLPRLADAASVGLAVLEEEKDVPGTTVLDDVARLRSAR